MPQAEWEEESSSEESSSEESSSEESFDDEASESESESGSEEYSSEYSSDSGADESLESGDEEEYFGDEEKGSRGNLFNEPSGNPKWTKLVPSKIVDKGLPYAAIFCFCICFIPLALIIGLSVGLTVGRDDGESTKAPTPTLSPNATPPPMVALTPAPTETPTIFKKIIKTTLLTAEASNTIYRTGANAEVSAGEEGVMLVQNAPPGDTELDSAYSLVEFDGILGGDSSLSVDEYLESIEGLAVDFCLTVSQASDEEQDYTTCLLSPDSATNVADLSGSTAPAYTIPDDCLNGQVITFPVVPGVNEVCVDIGPLLTETSNLRRRRRMQGEETKYLLMIDALEESDQRGTSFYSSADTEGRAPSLTIQGTNTCKTAAQIACSTGFTSLCALVKQAGLDDLFDSALRSEGKTIFAPTESAFENLASEITEAISDPENLMKLLKHHVVDGTVLSTDLECGAQTETVEGSNTTTLCGANGKFYQVGSGISPGVNSLPEIISADVDTCTGVVHVVDQLLVPEGFLDESVCGASVIPFLCAFHADEFSTLCALADGVPGLTELLPRNRYTIFAPTNAAFEKAFAAFGSAIDITDVGLITEVFLQHIVAGSLISYEDFVCDTPLEMANGAINQVTCNEDGDFFISGLGNVLGPQPKVTETDVLKQCNYNVLRVDELILPNLGDVDVDVPCPILEKSVLDVLVADSDSFSSLAAFATLADLVDPLVCLPNITLFAPDNDAFTQLTQSSPALVQLLQDEDYKTHLQNLLQYHLVPQKLSSADIADGQSALTASGDSLSFSVNKNNKIFVNGQIRVDSADLEADNGVVHLIEAVLLPDWVKKNIADVIGETPPLATINDFIAQANLAGILSQPASAETVYTVFAPTNEAIQGALAAFASIGIDDSETLTAILKQHIVPGVYSASALESVNILGSAAGTNLTFVTTAGNTTIDGNNIISSDILANNGIIHLIDGVLLPPSFLPGGGMVVGDGPSISMPVDGGPGMGAATQSCSICSGVAGNFLLTKGETEIAIPDGITITNIPPTGATCTLLEQACQFGLCDSDDCAALAALGLSDTCGCEAI